MEQRRKIIVPTGVEADEELPTPHFDAEATLLARPVVPLTEPVEPPPDIYPPARVAAARAHGAPAASSPWKRSTLILIIVAAVCVGIASGLAIGLYQSRRQKAPVAASTTTQAPAQPVVSEPQQQAAAQPEPEARQSARVEQPAEEDETQEDVSAASDDEEKREREPKRRADDEARDEDKPVARDTRKRDEERSAPPVVVRERPSEIPDLDEREERRIERREQRRAERREARRRQREENPDSPIEFPRNVERARQEINRIRDIFEGRQP
jgi:Tfp pilus assembly major pilin PilA